MTKEVDIVDVNLFFLIQSFVLFGQYYHSACSPDEHKNICSHQKGAVSGVECCQSVKDCKECHSHHCDNHRDEVQKLFDFLFHTYCNYGDKGKNF